jgi:hypothetical protein
MPVMQNVYLSVPIALFSLKEKGKAISVTGRGGPGPIGL